jgi:hypothetical protein
VLSVFNETQKNLFIICNNTGIFICNVTELSIGVQLHFFSFCFLIKHIVKYLNNFIEKVKKDKGKVVPVLLFLN